MLAEIIAACPAARLRIDANRSLTLDGAKRLFEGLDPARVEYLEEPLSLPLELPALHFATGLSIALDESLREALEAPLPEAKRTYYDVFTGMDVWDQLRVQANAERQGAQAWRNIASRTTDQRVIDEMATCSALEEASADRLDALIATHAP